MKRTPMPPSKIVPRKVPMTKAKALIKTRRVKLSPERAAANGKPCLIRVPGYCLGASPTVVGCHVPVVDHSGRGLKSVDTLIAYGCERCHGYVDGRIDITKSTKDGRRLLLLEGLARTLAYIAEHDNVG